MVIVRHSGRSSYLAKVEALGPDADELTVSCYNSYGWRTQDSSVSSCVLVPCGTRRVLRRQSRSSVRFVPYTNVVYRNQVVVRAVTLTAKRRLVPSVLQQVQSLHLSFKVPVRK